MKLGIRQFLVVFVALVAGSQMAAAVRQPAQLAGRPELEVASGLSPVRALRGVVWNRIPQELEGAWDRFTAANGPEWKLYYDADTGVPGRIFGRGVPAPGS